MIEQWKAVMDYEGLYEVSDLGRVRSLDRITGHKGRVLRPAICKRHYPMVSLSCAARRDPRPVHRLVLEAFVGHCPAGMEACHNNGDWNDCRLENLRWDTRKNNHADKKKHGTDNAGDKHYRRNPQWESRASGK